MSVIEPAARAAFLDGGWPAVLALAGGAVKVALYSAGVECSGGGYARPTIDALSLAVNNASGSYKDAEIVTFTPTGGGFTYDQVKILARNGTTLLMTGDVGGPFTVSGEAHQLTVQTQIPSSVPIACNTAAQLQASLDAQQSSKTPTRIAPADVPISTSLTMDGYFGPGVLYGEGAIEPAEDAQNMLLSVLRWAGARGVLDNDPILRYELGRGRLKHFAFRGATKAQIAAASVARAPMALLVRSAPGFGTGKILAEDIYFSYFRTAIKLAENLADANCDECSWKDCQFDRNDVAVELSAYQTLGHHFWHPRFGDNTIIFQITAGGDLSVTNGLMAGRNNVLFNFPDGSAENFGGNNNSYAINKLKVDAQATGCKIVNQFPETGTAYYSNFDLNGVHFPPPVAANGDEWKFWGGNTNLAPAIVASGNSTINLTNAVGIGRGMLQHQTGVQGVTRIRVIGADVFYRATDPITDIRELVDEDGSTGTAHYTFEGCHYNGQQGYYADWAGTI